MKAVVIFLGAPGSGKGTQSRHLMKKYGIPVLGMGDLLRKESKKNNETARYLSSFLENGNIVPWSLTRQIFENNIDSFFQKNIVILDGVPRNVEQAKDIDQILSDKGFAQIKVIHLDVSTSIIQHRLSHRLVCMNCQAPFSDEDFAECPFCAHTKTEIRTDDNISSIQNRIDVHHENMKELLQHYQIKNALSNIDANQSIQQVQQNVAACIKVFLQQTD